jgi:hypothetical protein
MVGLVSPRDIALHAPHAVTGAIVAAVSASGATDTRRAATHVGT